MNINKEKAGHINLFSIDTESPKSNVVIVGNAYGVMPYILPLAENLHKEAIKPYWFPFSGQEGTDGSYSFEQGKEDLKCVIDYIKSNSKLEINLISHCAGSLISFEYLKENNEQNINKMIVYGLLFSMNRRRNIAERKLINSEVRYNLSEEDWLYNPTNTIESLNKEILFCHSKDALNTERATNKEMETVASLRSNIHLNWFENGYDDSNELIPTFAKTYINYLNN